MVTERTSSGNTTNIFDRVNTDPDSLIEYEVHNVGKECNKYTVGATILCRKDMVREIKYDSLKSYKVILNEDIIFGELIKK